MSAPHPAPPPRLDILHLGFEDHRRPGSGGGGHRTHEINRRLAARGHRVTVLTTRYAGSRPRTEDGVRYRPLGVAAGYYGSIVSYHLSLPFVVAASQPDLVVEDFAAPMSSILSPLWTRRPTVAVVQWLFAAVTSKRYRLPFFLIETLGVRLHRRFIAASQYMAHEISRKNPSAVVDVVYAGVDAPDAEVRAPRGDDARTVLYLGRLEAGPKGLDLLLDAFMQLTASDDQVRLIIAGDGPDREDLEAQVEGMPQRHRIRFTGRVAGAGKWQLLRQATVLAVPSRYESFGLVAIEALASGTPVVAFDIPSMREILVDGSGELVPPFDTGLFAKRLTALLTDPDRQQHMREAGLVRARDFDWDTAARRQEDVYLAAVAEGARTSRRVASLGR